MNEHLLCAFLLTLGAGLATGIGSAIAFFANHTNKKFLSFALGMSAGVMIYVSFVELLTDALIALGGLLGEKPGQTLAVATFFGGIGIAALIDKIVPSYENPHEMRSVESMHRKHPPHHDKRLMRMGVLTAITVGLHNFPEGIATFMTALEAPQLGVAIAAAIAIHNIPEGIAISVPIFFATRSRKKAFWYSFLSGIAELVGAVVAYLVLMPFITPVSLNCVLAAVAGIMVYISFDELLPAAEEYGQHHIAIYGTISGMLIMAVSLILL